MEPAAAAAADATTTTTVPAADATTTSATTTTAAAAAATATNRPTILYQCQSMTGKNPGDFMLWRVQLCIPYEKTLYRTLKFLYMALLLICQPNISDFVSA